MGRPAKRPSGRGRGRPPKVVKVEETDQVDEDEKAGEKVAIEAPVKSEAKVEGSELPEEPKKPGGFKKTDEPENAELENTKNQIKVEDTVKQEKSKATEKQEKEETEIFVKPSRALRVVKAPRIVKTPSPRAIKTPRVATKVNKTEEVKVTHAKKAERIPKIERVTGEIGRKRTLISVKENKKSEQDNSDQPRKFSAHSTPAWQKPSSSYFNYGSDCPYWDRPENKQNNNPYPLTRFLNISYHEIDEDTIIHIEVDSEPELETSASSSPSSSVMGDPLETANFATASSAGVGSVNYVKTGDDNGESASSGFNAISGIGFEYTKQ